MIKLVRTFYDRFPYLGPAMWVLCVEYFITQLFVALSWQQAYSIRFNTISDLGNSVCGNYGARYVCSPHYVLMNLSFILLGLFIIFGSVLIYQEFRENRLSRLAFILMGSGGVGTVLVGLFPENTVSTLHVLGAALPFLLGNIALILFGLNLSLPKSLKIFTLTFGTLALISLIFLTTKHYLGLGIGGIERLTAYPQTIWLIVFGIYMSKSRYLKQRKLKTNSR